MTNKSHIPDVPCVYAIHSLADANRYIGSTINLRKRWKHHRTSLKRGNHGNQSLQSAYNTYGQENFICSVIELISDTTKLYEREQYWIDLSNPEYNIQRFTGQSRRGVPHSQETKIKISKSNKEHWAGLSDDEYKRRSISVTHPTSEATKAKLREIGLKRVSEVGPPMQGKHHTDETRRKLSELAQRQFAEQKLETARKRAEWELGREKRETERREKLRKANTGKRVSKATKAKLRQIALAQQSDPAYRAKHQAGLLAAMRTPEMHERLSKAHKGKKLSAEHKHKIAKAHKGRKNSPETIAAMSEKRRQWWAARKAAQVASDSD